MKNELLFKIIRLQELTITLVEDLNNKFNNQMNKIITLEIEKRRLQQQIYVIQNTKTLKEIKRIADIDVIKTTIIIK